VTVRIEAVGCSTVVVATKISKMTSNPAFTCLFFICVIGCTKEQFAASYLTPLVNRWSQYTGCAFRGQMSALPSGSRASEGNGPAERVRDQLETMRRKTLSAILLSCIISSISEMTLVGGCFVKNIILPLFIRIFPSYSSRPYSIHYSVINFFYLSSRRGSDSDDKSRIKSSQCICPRIADRNSEHA
jgi:hypothetical protein